MLYPGFHVSHIYSEYKKYVEIDADLIYWHSSFLLYQFFLISCNAN